MGIPKPALWTVLEVGKLLWRDGTVCEITLMDADPARVRVLGMVVCDYTTPSPVASTRVCRPRHDDTSSILYTDTPLRIDTAEVDLHGVVHISRSEATMLRDVELEVAAATNSSACESPHSTSSDSDSARMSRQRTRQGHS